MTFAAPAPRLVLGAPVAAFITIALAMMMQALIAQRDTIIEDPPTRPDVQFTSDREVTTPRDRERPVEHDEVAPPPPVEITIPQGETIEGGTSVFTIDPPLPPPPEGPPPGGFMTLGPQRIFAPLPSYPQRMYPREGVCTVGFDITAAGATTNVRTLSCSNNGFARSAVQAVERFQYKPAQSERGPVASAGHRVDVAFEVDE